MTADGPRIVIVGAGGWVFPMELVRDILSFRALRYRIKKLGIE